MPSSNSSPPAATAGSTRPPGPSSSGSASATPTEGHPGSAAASTSASNRACVHLHAKRHRTGVRPTWCDALSDGRPAMVPLGARRCEVSRDHDELAPRPERVIILDADDPMTEIHGKFVWQEEHERVVDAVSRQAYADGYRAGLQAAESAP